MTGYSRRSILRDGLCLAACVSTLSPRSLARPTSGKYVCPPCGCAADWMEFDAPGKCPACGMTLVSSRGLAIPFEPVSLNAGAGIFLAGGGPGREHKRIGVHYFVPSGFTRRSPILLVIPGTGRNAHAYREAWIEAAEASNVLVAALSYPETDYDFAAYHMGGVIRNLRIEGSNDWGEEGKTSYRLRDEDISFEINNRPDEWLFRDFDRIFSLITAATHSSRTGYDLFGHSAGGQILHRHVLFHPHSRADRIVAANSGFYTLPDLTVDLLFGLRNTGVTGDALRSSFAGRLVVLLGEEDNDSETGGIHLHTPLADRQGTNRLSRGKYFFRTGRNKAASLGAKFNWDMRVIAGVGHDFRAMSRAAARYLYS